MITIKKLKSSKSSQLCGSITLPGDKSISHRSVIFGSLAKGNTRVQNFLFGDDCIATINAFRAMGINIEELNNELIINGRGKYGLRAPLSPIDCGNSGTTMRLLAGILAAQKFSTTLIGDASLTKRPMQRIGTPLKLMGGEIETNNGCPPLNIKGCELKGIDYELQQASAQVKSCLLLAGMYAQGKTSIIEPEITRNHTELMLDTFGYQFEKNGNILTIDNKYECVGQNFTVPGDFSSAAFFIVAALITPDSELILKGVGINPTRTGMLEILQLMGGDIVLKNERLYGKELVADIVVKSSKLHGIEIARDLVSRAIDEFPVIFIAAAAASGTTILKNAKELRFKESDRIEIMAQNLKKIGVRVETLPDGIIIHHSKILGGEVAANHDHRIAMAFAIAGLIAESEIIIDDFSPVSTSFPNFLEVSKVINMKLEFVNE